MFNCSIARLLNESTFDLLTVCLKTLLCKSILTRPSLNFECPSTTSGLFCCVSAFRVCSKCLQNILFKTLLAQFCPWPQTYTTLTGGQSWREPDSHSCETAHYPKPLDSSKLKCCGAAHKTVLITQQPNGAPNGGKNLKHNNSACSDSLLWNHQPQVSRRTRRPRFAVARV